MTAKPIVAVARLLLMLTLACVGTVPTALAAGAEDLHDITEIEQVPPAAPGLHGSTVKVAAFGVGVLLAAGLAGLGWVFLRRSARRPVPLAPDQWALHELERLESLGLPAAGAFERYHTLLSDVVRRYLEQRFGFPAPEQTTTETLRAWTQSAALPDAQRSLLQDFLERCDLAKFAPTTGNAEECRATADQARRFIQETARLLLTSAAASAVPSSDAAQWGA